MGRHGKNPGRTSDYTVGYGKPPEATRFQKGKSGNRNGRPRASKSLSEEAFEMFQERVTVHENGKPITMTKRTLLLKKAYSKAVNGDHRSIELMFRLASNHRPDEVDGRDRRSLDQADLDLLKDYLRRTPSLDQENDGE